MKYQTLQIYRPCISKNETQGWGENRACLDNYGRIFGVAKGKSCPGLSYYQSVGMKGHSGIDIAGLKGQDIYHAATFDGWWKADHDSAGGLGVDVVSNQPLFFAGPIPAELQYTAVKHVQDGKEGFLHHVKMRYWHLSMPVGHEGKKVTCGTVIGLMGNTGASSGTHLHFAPKWCDRNGKGVGQSNGYYGAFDPTPYYNNRVTAAEHIKFTNQKPVPLTQVEINNIESQLSLLQQILLTFQKLKTIV